MAEDISKRIARFIEPFRIPLLAILCIAVVALGLSRVLLAVSEIGAVVVFIAVGTTFLLGGILLAARPAITKNVITIVLFVGAVVIIAAGTIAAVHGQREFEHKEEQVGVTPGGGEGSLGPIGPGASAPSATGPSSIVIQLPAGGVTA